MNHQSCLYVSKTKNYKNCNFVENKREQICSLIMLQTVKKCMNLDHCVQQFCEEPRSDLEMEAILSAAKQQHHQDALIKYNGKLMTN